MSNKNHDDYNNNTSSSSNDDDDENDKNNSTRNRSRNVEKKKPSKKRSKKKHKRKHRRSRRDYDDSDSSNSEDDSDHDNNANGDNGDNVDNDDNDDNDDSKDRKIEKKRHSKKHHKRKHRSAERYKNKHRRKRKESESEDSSNSNNSDDSNSNSDSDSERSNRKRKKKTKKKRRKKSSRHDDSDDDNSDEYYDNKRSKKRHKKDKKQQLKEKTQHSEIESKFHKILPQLHNLLTNHPGLATELPYLLIKMCSGSSINLSNIQDISLSTKLGEIFTTLGCTRLSNSSSSNEFIFDDNGNWKNTSNGSSSRSDERALVLVKMVRFLLNDNGFTMEKMQQFESKEIMDKVKERQMMEMTAAKKERDMEESKDKNNVQSKQDETSSLISMLLDTFQSKQQQQSQSPSSSLAQELCSIMTMILDGEIICLDGLEDESLRESIEKLFVIIGLVKEEMDDDEDDDDEDDDDNDINDNNDDNSGDKNDNIVKGGEDTSDVQMKDKKDISYGYTLPPITANDDENDADNRDDDANNDVVKAIKLKLANSIKATETYHRNYLQKINAAKEKSEKRRVMGPSLPSNMNTTKSAFDSDENDSEDDDGPAPFGSKKANARTMKCPTQPAVQNMTKNPKSEREEWMMVPGEHNFLKGVMSSGTIKNRKFKNEKNRGDGSAPPVVPMHPEMKRQVDSIMDAHSAARGPSLVEQHREKVAEEKAAKAAAANGQKGADWNWSKKDLDEGRRVDKNYLHMVLGGASTELKSKFQGSFSSGFT